MVDTVHSNRLEDVVARREAWCQHLESELDRMVDVLRDRPDIARVVLFGSLARGEARWHSDIDLVVVQRTDIRAVDRIEAMLRLLQPRVDLDVIVYTPAEWDVRVAEDAFARRVQREGRVVYAHDAA